MHVIVLSHYIKHFHIVISKGGAAERASRATVQSSRLSLFVTTVVFIKSDTHNALHNQTRPSLYIQLCSAMTRCILPHQCSGTAAADVSAGGRLLRVQMASQREQNPAAV